MDRDAGRNQLVRLGTAVARHRLECVCVGFALGTDATLLARGVNVRARSQDHVDEIVKAVRDLDRVEVVEVSDPVFRMHQGGKIAVQSKIPLASRETLSMAYTPGVARVSAAIA